MKKRLTIALLALITCHSSFALTPTPTPTPTPSATPSATPAPSPQAIGQNFTVSWTDANPASAKVAGYHLKYGTASGNYTTTVDVKVPTLSKDFSAFAVGTYYFALTAYNTAGVESAPSGEVVAQVLSTPMAPGTPTITSAAPSGLVNISTRAQVSGGDNAMIAGFILNNPERVAVRALGPSLGGGLGALSQASVELHDQAGAVLDANNGWRSGPDAAELSTQKLAPASDKESALIASLSPGNYTAIVRGGTDEPGVGLVEVYALK
ncbi:MAG: fibronectin type III domain-containing protein [Sphingomonadaceae bacterium]|nr:fibronectin type III domain-containing protein [Sphingomonadaceae bacterium]